jgi:hypothetical protein
MLIHSLVPGPYWLDCETHCQLLTELSPQAAYAALLRREAAFADVGLGL